MNLIISGFVFYLILQEAVEFLIGMESGFNNYFIGSPQINVNHIFIDDMNIKWIATSEGFIVYDAQNNSTAFRTYNSLISSNIIKSCVRDLNGNVWITTFASGLNKYKPPR